MPHTRSYVGIRPDGVREVFGSSVKPTTESHGERFEAVIGPFRTKAGAEIMAGPHGPNCQTVAQAERQAKSSGIAIAVLLLMASGGSAQASGGSSGSSLILLAILAPFFIAAAIRMMIVKEKGGQAPPTHRRHH